MAIDAATGKMKWYFQTTHHDIYDWDLNSPPVLADITTSDGKKVAAVIQNTKQGYLFVLDRATGKPILPVEEKARACQRRAGRSDVSDATGAP